MPSESFNLTVQKEVAGGWTAQAGWVGTHALKEYSGVNINYGQLGGGAANQPLFPFGITASTTQVQPLNSDIYHSLQTMLTKRFAHGFTTGVIYTFAKDITFQPGVPAGAGLTSATIIIPQYRSYDRYVSSLDRTNTFNWSTTYEFPFGRNKPLLNQGLLSQIVADGP